MAATQTGVFVNFGFTGTDGLTEATLTGKGLLQSADYEPGSDEYQLKNAAGALATRVFPEVFKKATLEWIPGSSTNVAGSITSHSALVALYHTIINISACTSMPELVDSHWLVVGMKSSGSNTDAKKITLSLEQYAGITTAPA